VARVSLRAVLDSIRRILAAATGAPARERAAADLLAISRVLARQPRLRTALTDPSMTTEAKRGLAEAVFGPTVSADAIELLMAVVDGQRLRPSQLPGAIDEVAAQALMDVADEAGRLAEAGDQMVAFARMVERDHALRSALTDPALPAERKEALIEDLLAGKADRRAVVLIQHWVARDQARRLTRLVEDTIAEAAARRERVVAQVTSAIPLDGDQRARLAQVMERVTGRPVDLQVEVDRGVVGSLSVRVGEQVYDGTVKRQLELLRDRLGGGAQAVRSS